MGKGCGFVKFSFREDAAHALSELKEKQRKWVVEWATSNNDPENLKVDKNNIFIGSLNPQEISEELLSEHFSVYGDIESITLINREDINNNEQNFNGVQSNQTDDLNSSTSRPRNAFAFIRYKEQEHSAAAIQAENGKEWLGNKLRVQYCESKEMKNKRRAKHPKFSPYSHPPYYPGMAMMLTCTIHTILCITIVHHGSINQVWMHLKWYQMEILQVKKQIMVFLI